MDILSQTLSDILNNWDGKPGKHAWYLRARMQLKLRPENDLTGQMT